MFTSSTPKIIYFYKNLIKDEKFVSAHIAFFCATCANVPSGTNIENIEKTSIYGTFGTEMPHGTLAQVALTSYMKGEFLYQLFIIMSINLQGGGLTAVSFSNLLVRIDSAYSNRLTLSREQSC